MNAKLLANVFGIKEIDRSKEGKRPRKLRVEQLEERSLLSVSVAEFAAVCGDGFVGLSSDDLLAARECREEPDPRDFVDSSGCLDCQTYSSYSENQEAIPAFDETVDRLLISSGQNPAALSEDFIFNLSSCPDSSYTIYLDFDGHVCAGTNWNKEKDSNGRLKYGEVITTPRYDVDYDATSFSNDELRDIFEIWYRVSEDFMPFNVNVTTKEPTLDQLIRTDSDDSEYGVRMAIGGSCFDWYNEGAGGVAYLESFTWDSDTPAFAFPWSTLYNGIPYPKYVAAAVAHEAGHTLGLTHDGAVAHDGVARVEYYDCDNGWGPIMGSGYNAEITQWSKGEYEYASNRQDDLEIIATRNGFDYRDDDHGDSVETATPLTFVVSGTLGSGIIERNTDVDFFSFELNGEETTITIGGADTVTNLDAIVNLYDSSGKLIETFDPIDTFYVSIDVAELTPGTYYLGVAGTGRSVGGVLHYSDYASLGAYAITADNLTPTDPYEPNDSYSNPYDFGLMSGISEFSGPVVGASDQGDWYKFAMGETGDENCFIKTVYERDPERRCMYLGLYDSELNRIRYHYRLNMGEAEVSLDGLSEGTYYVYIFNYPALTLEEPYPYSLTISVPELEPRDVYPVESVATSTLEPTVGTTITATVAPENADVVWQWYRGTRSDFVKSPIVGANGSSYTPTAEDVGYYLSVRAEGVGDYEGIVSATTVAPVVCGVFVTIPDDGAIDHSDDFVNGVPSRITLREAVDYINRPYVGGDLSLMGNGWEEISDDLVDPSTGKYSVAGTSGFVYKKILFAESALSPWLEDKPIVSDKTFSIDGSVGDSNVCVSGVSPDDKLQGDCERATRIFDVVGGTIAANNLDFKDCRAFERSVGANVDYVDPAPGCGGAIYIGDSGTYVANGGSIYEVRAEKNGGAFYVAAGGTLEVVDVAFSSNAAERGGAIWNKGNVSITGDVSFVGNVAATSSDSDVPTNGGFGGAIYNGGNGTVALIGNSVDGINSILFQDNEASGTGVLATSNRVLKGYSGGAIYNTSEGIVSATNVTFDGNFAGKYGGAVSNFATFEVANATFSNNIASSGGALQNAGVAELTDVDFVGNAALRSSRLIASTDFGGNGGAIFTSRTADQVGTGLITFYGSASFRRNEASNAGGAIDYVDGAMKFDGANTTIAGNSAKTFGGGLVVSDNVEIVNGSEFNVDANFIAAPTASGDAFHIDPLQGDVGYYAPNVAITCDVGDQAIADMTSAFFPTEEGQPAPGLDKVALFVRYVSTATAEVRFEDLAATFKSKPSVIYASVDDDGFVKLSADGAEPGSVASVSLTAGEVNVVRYYEDGEPNVVYRANINVVADGATSVVVSKFDLEGLDVSGWGACPVGVSIRIYSTSNEPVSTWTLNWGDGDAAQKTEFNNYGFVCNAYHFYENAGSYRLNLTTDSGASYDLGWIDAKPSGSSGAELDLDDFFADDDWVDELFD